MEIVKTLVCRTTNRSYLRKFTLVKIDSEYYWELHFFITNKDFVRFNSIIRPIIVDSFNTSRFRFFEKDLSEECEDVIYFQDNVDSHLE